MSKIDQLSESIRFYFTSNGVMPDSITMGYDYYNAFILEIIGLGTKPSNFFEGINVYRCSQVVGGSSFSYVLGENFV